MAPVRKASLGRRPAARSLRGWSAALAMCVVALALAVLLGGCGASATNSRAEAGGGAETTEEVATTSLEGKTRAQLKKTEEAEDAQLKRKRAEALKLAEAAAAAQSAKKAHRKGHHKGSGSHKSKRSSRSKSAKKTRKRAGASPEEEAARAKLEQEEIAEARAFNKIERQEER